MAWVASDNFNSYSDGALAGNNGGSGWSGAWASDDAGWLVQGTTVFEGAKGVGITATDSASSKRDLATPVTGSGNIMYFAWRRSASGGDFDFNLRDGSDNACCVLRWNGTTIKGYGDGSVTVVGSTTFNIWYLMRVTFNVDADTFTAAYNTGSGWSSESSSISFVNPATSIDRIRFNRDSDAADDYFDYISDTDPTLLYGITHYWKLDESSGNAADSVGSSTLTNNNSVGYAAGLINNGIDLGTANTNKYMSVASNLGVTGGAISISGWMNVRTAPSGVEYFLAFQASSTNNIRYKVLYLDSAGTKKAQVSRATPGNSGSDKDIQFNVDFGTGSWHHLVLTYDATTLKGYVDGVLRMSDAASGNGSIDPGNTFDLGVNQGIDTFASAYIDEVGFWNRALVAAEVTSLYNGGAGIQYPFIPSASGPSNLKSYNTNAKANIKSINTNPIANIKALNTNT